MTDELPPRPPYLETFDDRWSYASPAVATTRAQVLHNFRLFAGGIFAQHPDIQSVMVCVAQYWNDEADDAIHSQVITSHRRVPVWPHVCIHGDPWQLELDQTFGDLGNCCQEFYWQKLPDYFPFPQRGTTIFAFEPYCSEEQHEHAFRPYAVARRTTGDDVELELLAILHRPAAQRLPAQERAAAAAAVRPLDERAAALLTEACDADDDGPRQVLADYLLDRGDPRGEYLALALEPALGADGRARRDALLAEHQWSWIDPLALAIPRDHARFERGLLAAADVFVEPADLPAIEHAVAWASVERLHFLPGSADFVSPVMRALHEVGPLRTAGLAGLAAHEWPRLTRLQVALREPIDHQHLHQARLPRLRELISDRPLPSTFGGAAWWPQLERVTFTGSPELAPDWLARRTHPIRDVPWVATCELGADGRLAGWELAAGRTTLEVRMRGWHPEATRTRLRDLLASAPPLPVVLIATPHWAPTADDAAALEAPGRTIAIS